MKFSKNKILILFPIALVIISSIYFFDKNSSKEIQISGLIESDEIDIASKIPGRIDTIFVKRGQLVKKGQTIAKLESKEMDAKVEQAFGAMEAAKAKYALACNGARTEEIHAAENMYLQANAQFDFAEKTWKRIQNLYNEHVISLQEKDEAEFKYKAAKEQMEAAKSKYELIKSGARNEDIIAAKSLFHQAENIYKEVMAYHDELNIVAPGSGMVSNIYCDFGEIINSGYPVISLIPDNNNYLTINIREDLLQFFKMGKVFQVNIPALGSKVYKFRVDFISSLADFANWRPTNQKGDFDLKTFEIRLTSLDDINGLRSGMTANFKLTVN